MLSVTKTGVGYSTLPSEIMAARWCWNIIRCMWFQGISRLMPHACPTSQSRSQIRCIKEMTDQPTDRTNKSNNLPSRLMRLMAPNSARTAPCIFVGKSKELNKTCNKTHHAFFFIDGFMDQPNVAHWFIIVCWFVRQLYYIYIYIYHWMIIKQT